MVLVNELKWSSVDVMGNLMWCLLVVIYVVQTASPVQGSAGVIALGGVFMAHEYVRSAEGSMSALAKDRGEGLQLLPVQDSGSSHLQPFVGSREVVQVEPRAPLS